MILAQTLVMLIVSFVGRGPWSCKNALAEALTCHDVGEVAMHGLFPDVASFPTGGAADADPSRPGQFFNNR